MGRMPGVLKEQGKSRAGEYMTEWLRREIRGGVREPWTEEDCQGSEAKEMS